MCLLPNFDGCVPGVVGVAPSVPIYSLKVLDGAGQGMHPAAVVLQLLLLRLLLLLLLLLLLHASFAAC